MMASSRNAFALSDSEVAARLTHPTLVPAVNCMLQQTENTVLALTDDQLIEQVTASAPEGMMAEHAWMLSGPAERSECDAGVLEYTHLLGHVRASLDHYLPGVPELHVRIVRAEGTTFAVCWEVSLAKMHALFTAQQPINTNQQVATAPARQEPSGGAQPRPNTATSALERARHFSNA